MAQNGAYFTYINFASPGSSVLSQTPMGAYHSTVSGTGAQHRVTDRSTPGDLKNFYTNVLTNANPNTATLTVRKNGSTGNLSISIAGSATGILTDLTGSDSIADGDTFNHALSIGASGAAIALICGVQFETPGQFAFQPAAGIAAGSNLSAASTTSYAQTYGIFSPNTSENLRRFAAIGPVTLSKMQVYASANGRSTDTTMVSRNNGADGNQLITIAAGATGLFEDTTNSDSVADGDYYNFKFTTGTGTGNLTLRYASFRIETSADSWCPVYGNTGFAVSAGATVQRAFVNNTLTGGAPIPYAAHASQLCATISANGVNADSTLSLRVNGAASALVVAIPATTTGRFIDTTHAVALVAGDLIDVEVVAGAGGTSLTVREQGVLICADKSLDATDSLLPKTDEASTNLLATARTDTLLPKTDETAALLALLAITDTLLPKTDETATLLALLSATDTLLPKTDEAAVLAVLLARVDELLVLLTDAATVDASSTTTEIDVTDVLLPKLSELLTILVVLSRVDDLLPKLTETLSTLVQLVRSDSLTPSTAESAAVLAMLSRVDALLPKTTETLSIAAFLSRADVLLPMLSEVADVRVLLARDDQLAPKTAELSLLAALYTVTDQLRIGLTDAASLDLVTLLARALIAGVDIEPLLSAMMDIHPVVSAVPDVEPLVDADPKTKA